MKRSIAARAWNRGALALVALLAAGCSGQSFSSSGSGGSGGTGGGAGSAGAGGAGCSQCSAGEYCQASRGKCVGCGDLSQLDFGPPEPLAAIDGNNVTSGLRFPRVAGANGNSLLYVADNHALNPPGEQIWFTASPDTDPGKPVSASTSSASGPLYVKYNLASTNADVVFDRAEDPTQDLGKRDLCTALLASKTFPANSGALPQPFNTLGTDDYSIAVASDVHRAWWMTNRDTGGAHLVTLALDSLGSPQSVILSIQIDATNTCQTSTDDLTPWATPDGSVMLFSATRRGTGCHANDNQKRGLYWVKLGQNGRPEGGAAGKPLAINQAGVDQTDPSLSPDLCTLYYAANDGNGFKLYRASRR